MELTLRAATPAERKYAYNQSQQIAMQCGCIGYLQGDFGSTGTQLHSKWTDRFSHYREDDFSAESDTIIQALQSDERFGGILKDRLSMESYCRRRRNVVFQGNFAKEYGFRLDTEKHAYLIRCIPTVGDNNFYVYAYVAKHLDRHMERAEQGIRFVDVNGKTLFQLTDGESITITHRDTEQVTRVCRFIDTYHVEIGSHLYHIDEFASKLQQAGSHCRPAEIKRDKTNRGGR
jgi:hypothetical protein